MRMWKHQDIVIFPENGACSASLSSESPLEMAVPGIPNCSETCNYQTREQVTTGWQTNTTMHLQQDPSPRLKHLRRQAGRL